MLQVGKRAPTFNLESDSGEKVSLASLRGKRVVLYFYPKDDTPGCTQESCDFRDNLARVKAQGAVVYGVSKDSVGSHQKFKQKFSLPFPLLSDPSHAMIEKYGVWKEKKLYGRAYMGVERTTVIIDEHGKVAQIFLKVKVTGHAESVIEALQSM
ncbi:MAG TPA: thioredoxin-dependent thiol peroxidase [Nitrospirales bacterium]|nr:thioredoxin-dependent thiol peroxidase [Nitrospirales bacterium]HIA13814.1 thioredoxin-dependent thiol peroxidase [Nitrospirales bacterium]HIB54010.1 thioredoxin-dependent thiol peroxidase [Nitrospirales bacterium]HIC04003.1 thioredoxin-dependent thiol peroxidase [Nitrospirales bacterium]HIN33875.1 thioredoxin-dependent thiol peroxidase [Nitrospirales bacterium]